MALPMASNIQQRQAQARAKGKYVSTLDGMQDRIINMIHILTREIPLEAKSLVEKKRKFLGDHEDVLKLSDSKRMYQFWMYMVFTVVYITEFIVIADAYDTFIAYKFPEPVVVVLKFAFPLVVIGVYLGIVVLIIGLEQEDLDRREATALADLEYSNLGGSDSVNWQLKLAPLFKVIPFLALGAIFLSRAYLYEFDKSELANSAAMFIWPLTSHLLLLTVGTKCVNSTEYSFVKIRLGIFDRSKHSIEKKVSRINLNIRQDADRFYDTHAQFGRELPDAHAQYRVRFDQTQRGILQRITGDSINWNTPAIPEPQLFANWDKPWDGDDSKNGGSTGDSSNRGGNGDEGTGIVEPIIQPNPINGGGAIVEPVIEQEDEQQVRVAEVDFIETQTEVTA
jgi:hypothetical protein